MRLPSILTLVGALFLSAFAALAQNRSDDAVLDMQQAFRRGDTGRLSALLPKVQGHPLEALAAYWEIKARLNSASDADIQAFLQRYAGSYYEDRLRNDWLLMVGKRRDWATLAREYPLYRMGDDRELRCYALAADAVLRKTDVTAEAVKLWISQREADDGCTWLIEHLHANRKLPALHLWIKARLAVDANRPRAARDAVSIEAPGLSEQVTLIFNDPVKYIDKRLLAITRNRKELAVLALIRLAASDPDKAAQLLENRWGLMLTAEEKNWTWAVIGKQAAFKLQDKASDHFAKTRQDNALSDELLTWKVRTALRAGHWQQVLNATEAMGETTRQEPVWRYWRARALLATANTEAQRQQAQQLLRSMASVRGFYEQLALEELGQTIGRPEPPPPLSSLEKAQAWANPGLQRALYATAIGLRAEGNREWNYTTNLHSPGGMSDRELLAAADLACQHQLWDRCINTSERTKDVIDLEQRFPAPLREAVMSRAHAIGLEPAYVYGLIRQESRFIMDARSQVGASGLMQVMPATAKWTAKKLGMTDFTPEQLTDKEVNVAIGTGYLKLVLDDFGGSMALAAAAYNAGPSRARNWRNGPVLEAAIWAESIPFQETRDYVKKVLSNTTNYAALLTGKPQSLKARLGSVGPRALSAPSENTDLP